MRYIFKNMTDVLKMSKIIRTALKEDYKFYKFSMVMYYLKHQTFIFLLNFSFNIATYQNLSEFEYTIITSVK